MKSKGQEEIQKSQENENVTFLLKVPKDLWQKFIKTVPISRTRHQFIIELIQRRVWEYEKATKNI